MLIEFAATTHRGRVRRNNEDAFLVSAMNGDEPSVNAIPRGLGECGAGLLAAVADGMGGAAAGEIASREGLVSMAVNMFGRWGRFDSQNHSGPNLWTAMRTATEQASKAVLQYTDEERTARGMGCTLTAVVFWNSCAYFAQIGDSRAYLFRESQLVQLTRDQTFVSEMLSSGALTPEQARTHPQRSVIMQALGAPLPLEVALGKVRLCRGDRLLICSDGLHGELTDEAIKEVFMEQSSPEGIAGSLVRSALDRGARDNVTAVVLATDDDFLPRSVPGEPVPVFAPPAI